MVTEIMLWQVFETPTGQCAIVADDCAQAQDKLAPQCWNGKFPPQYRYLGAMWAGEAPFLPGWDRLANWWERLEQKEE